jgi:hypothetical protein
MNLITSKERTEVRARGVYREWKSGINELINYKYE